MLAQPCFLFEGEKHLQVNGTNFVKKGIWPHIHCYHLNKWQFILRGVSKGHITVTQLKILGFRMGAFELGVMEFGKL